MSSAGATPLLSALGLNRGVVSLVGGGGKTSLALCLIREASSLGLRAVFTTTTQIYPPDFPLLIWPSLPENLPDGASCVSLGLTPEGKLAGLLPEQVGQLARRADLVVVEADGSRGLPLKYPLAHEPVIPPCSDLVLAVAGVTVVHQPLSPQWVHRAEAAAAFLGAEPGQPISPDQIAQILWHPDGATRGRPQHCTVLPVINQVDSPEGLAGGLAIARSLVQHGAPRVLLTNALWEKPVVAVVTGGKQA
ncbi:MAG: selenium cofactor biosynthesis protein YqeC [Mycobacterium leprae]